MKINKFTAGFVHQVYDTDSKTWDRQGFVAGDECDYEDDNGRPVDMLEIHEEKGEDEPYLPFEMVQPGVDVAFCRESIQEDLRTILDGEGITETQMNRICQIVVDNFKKFNLS